MRENHYAILASVSEFPTFTNYKISITLLIISRCRDRMILPTAKLIIIFEISTIPPSKFSNFITTITASSQIVLIYLQIPTIMITFVLSNIRK